MAMVKAISEQCDVAYPAETPGVGGFIHYGATSQDINDTVTALQLKECKASTHMSRAFNAWPCMVFVFVFPGCLVRDFDEYSS